MAVWRSLWGEVGVRILTADPAGFLNRIENAGIRVSNIRSEDALTLVLVLPRTELKRLRSICYKVGAKLSLTERQGVYWALKGLLQRPVLVVGLGLLLAVMLYLPTRVLFVTVEGNTTVPTRLILEKASGAGVYFCASRGNLRSERVKNALLEALPQLQWVGVNTRGCVAVLTVREREPGTEPPEKLPVSSIVASRDAVVTRCTAEAGTQVCQVGQAVQKGQVLISGYTDQGLAIRAEGARGEVFGLTHRDLTAVFPTESAKRTEINGVKKKYALILGKNRINFYKGSGISPAGCDKMYLENYVTLPGGFVLPVAFVTEVWTQYRTEPSEDTQKAEDCLKVFAKDYLHCQITAGKVVTADQRISQQPGFVLLEGQYSCEEMIGVRRNEEIYGKSN